LGGAVVTLSNQRTTTVRRLIATIASPVPGKRAHTLIW
jgi:hypothetical protein